MILPLKKKGIDVLILEANTRIGGRIETVTGTTRATMEMVPPGLVNRISICLVRRTKYRVLQTHPRHLIF
jgi:monoamine oxidase